MNYIALLLNSWKFDWKTKNICFLCASWKYKLSKLKYINKTNKNLHVTNLRNPWNICHLHVILNGPKLLFCCVSEGEDITNYDEIKSQKAIAAYFSTQELKSVLWQMDFESENSCNFIFIYRGQQNRKIIERLLAKL